VVGLLVAALLGPAALPRPAAAQAPAAPVVVPTVGGDVSVLADRMEEVGPERLLVATGNVEITRGRSRLIADRVEINRDTGDAVAQGRVVFYDGEDQLTGRRIDYNLKTGTGVVYESEARVAPYYRISGERMDRLGESVYHVQRGVFTTCEDDPPAWSFKFGSANADLEDFVYGTNASFWVKDIPLIPFFPFFAAAIRRERQTGFLFPKLGISGDKGFQVELPFYWAISDSADATIAPIAYSERGFGFSSEVRYVLSTEQRGSFTGFLLQETFRNDATRGVGSVRHDWTLAPGLTLKVDLNGVTGDSVLREYGDLLQQRSAQRVESNVFLTRTWESWNFVGNVFTYQDLTTRRPIELHRLPDLNLIGVRQPIPELPGFLWEMETSYVNFVRDVGSNGQRLDVHPRISRPISANGLFTVTPFLGGRLTGYDTLVTGFHNTKGGVSTPIEETEKEWRLRRLFEAGTDVETQFSRVYQVGGIWGVDAILHSIEPRVNYTWITGKGQDRLPVWTEGVDRIPDTSRVEYSLTNRVRARTVALADGEPRRWEALRLALGHSYDLRDSRTGDITATAIVSPVERIRLRGDIAHSIHGEGVQVATSDLIVSADPVSVSVGSRYSDPGRFNFITTGLVADISRYVTIRNANFFDARTLSFVESRAAADIKFQCWALTVEFVHREGRDDEVRFAVNLLGVGGPIRTSFGLGALTDTGER
jgi:LPS-assembly protein